MISHTRFQTCKYLRIDEKSLWKYVQQNAYTYRFRTNPPLNAARKPSLRVGNVERAWGGLAGQVSLAGWATRLRRPLLLQQSLSWRNILYLHRCFLNAGS